MAASNESRITLINELGFDIKMVEGLHAYSREFYTEESLGKLSNASPLILAFYSWYRLRFHVLEKTRLEDVKMPTADLDMLWENSCC